ncbi:MAG: hypothetical protein ACJA0W_003560 [Candidatus Azotimanducaceae bacterium]|jgi:hypothetical protein
MKPFFEKRSCIVTADEQRHSTISSKWDISQPTLVVVTPKFGSVIVINSE